LYIGKRWMETSKGCISIMKCFYVGFGLCLMFFLVSSKITATDVGGYINSDSTWGLAGSPYILTTSVILSNNATLSVDSGVAVQMNGYGIAANYRSYAPGYLQASNVAFTGNGSAYLTFEYQGSGGSIENCRLDGVSIYASNGNTPTVVDNVISRVEYPLSLASGSSPVFQGNDISDCANQGIQLYSGTTIDWYLPDYGYPYILDIYGQNLIVAQNATVTIQSGTEVVMNNRSIAMNYTTSTPGHLLASNVSFVGNGSEMIVVENDGSSALIDGCWLNGVSIYAANNNAPVISDCTIEGVDYALTLSSGGVPVFSGNDVTGCVNQTIALVSGSDADWTLPDYGYDYVLHPDALAGAFRFSNGATLSIPFGVTIEMLGRHIDLGYSQNSLGHLQAAGVSFLGSGSESMRFLYSGCGGTIDSCQLDGVGIVALSSDFSITGSVLMNTDTAVWLLGDAGPTISGNQFCGNSTALRNDGTARVVAHDNWWGDASGPYHASLNPDGLGETVMGDVDFEPWLTTGCQYEDIVVTLFAWAGSSWAPANGVTFDLHEPIVYSLVTRGNEVRIDYSLSALEIDEVYTATLGYVGANFPFDFYYPQYLHATKSPLYYDVYLYPEREYFRGDSSQIAWVVSTRTPAAAESVEPVLLVEGTYPKSDYWASGENAGTSYRQKFQADGYDVFEFNYPSLQNIRHSAASLGEVVGDILNRYYAGDGTRQFNVVTHSQGGIVARAYTVGLGEYDGATVSYGGEFKSLTEIAPTNHGTVFGFMGEYRDVFWESSLGFLADVFKEFDVPATKMQSSGSKFIWELNEQPLATLTDNGTNKGHLVIAGSHHIMGSLAQGWQAGDGVVNVASSSLLHYGNIPLVLLPTEHTSWPLSPRSGFLADPDMRGYVFNVVNSFISGGYSNAALGPAIGELTDGQGEYIDLDNMIPLSEVGGQAEQVEGSIILQPTNPVASQEENYKWLVLKQDNGRRLRTSGRLILNTNNDSDVALQGMHYDYSGPETYIPYTVPLKYRGVLEEGSHEVYIGARRQTWALSIEDGKTLLQTQEFEYPKRTVRFAAFCPVNLVVTTPDGLTIDTSNHSGANWVYWEGDIDGDGELDHVVDVADYPSGEFTVRVLPHDTALATDTVSLLVEHNDHTDTLLWEKTVDDVDASGYLIELVGGCCLPPTVGDLDQSGGVDIVDIQVMIDHQFLTLQPLVCFEEGDINSNVVVDITDLQIMIDYQFLSLTEFPPCP